MTDPQLMIFFNNTLFPVLLTLFTPISSLLTLNFFPQGPSFHLSFLKILSSSVLFQATPTYLCGKFNDRYEG